MTVLCHTRTTRASIADTSWRAHDGTVPHQDDSGFNCRYFLAANDSTLLAQGDSHQQQQSQSLRHHPHRLQNRNNQLLSICSSKSTYTRLSPGTEGCSYSAPMISVSLHNKSVPPMGWLHRIRALCLSTITENSRIIHTVALLARLRI